MYSRAPVSNQFGVMWWILFCFCGPLMLVLNAVPIGAQEPRIGGDIQIDFENPTYPPGDLPVPWEVIVAGGGYAQVMSSLPYAGDQCLVLNGWSPGGSSVRSEARFPLSIDPANGNVTIRIMVRPSLYEPGSYDPGYVTLGGFFVSNDLRNFNYSETGPYGYILELYIGFEMAKPYGQPFNPGQLSLLVGNYYTPLQSVGGYTRGGYHEVIATWDNTAGTVDVTIILPGGAEYHRLMTSGRRPLNRLQLFGQLAPSIPDPCRYDNLSVSVPLPTQYTITLSSNPQEGGTVEGAGLYDEGATVTAIAHPAEGYSFVRWTEEESEVCGEEVFQFSCGGDRSLTANFVPTQSTVWAIY
jgi:hypothetical protein